MSASPTRRTASPDADPGARWQQIREEWLARPAPSSKSAVIEGDDAAAGQPAGTTTTAEPAKTKTKRGRDPVFQQRIATLEQLLREANALATGTSPAKLSIAQPRPLDLDSAVVPSLAQTGSAGNAALNGTGAGQLQQEEPEEEEEPDGGMPIRDHAAQGDPTHELKKVSESIFLAFKQGRPLREPLPLALVTSLLFRSWYLDGTIPADYKSDAPTLPPPPPPEYPPPASAASIAARSGAPMPIPRHVLAEEDGNSLVSSPGTSPVSEGSSSYLDRPRSGSGAASGSGGRPGPSERRPSLLAALAERNSNAVTPLPSSDESDPPPRAGAKSLEQQQQKRTSTLDTTPSPSGTGPSLTAAREEARPGARPIQVDRTAAAAAAAGSTSRSPSLEGMGASSTSGKLQLDLLRGSRWRTEQEVASGSDVI